MMVKMTVPSFDPIQDKENSGFTITAAPITSSVNVTVASAVQPVIISVTIGVYTPLGKSVLMTCPVE